MLLSLTASGSHLFFSYFNGSGAALFALDGSAAGASALPIVDPGGTPFANPGPTNLTDINGTLYFQQADDIHGAEVWKSDGNTATFVADVNPGSDPNPGFPDVARSSSPFGFVAFNNKVYFIANDNTHGFELWETDGTAANTHIVGNINPGTGSGLGDPNGEMIVFNNALYFPGSDGAANHGVELWRVEVKTDVELMVADLRT